jgi:hypothetical protein
VACFEVLLDSRQSRANCFSLIAQQRARRQVQPIVSTANRTHPAKATGQLDFGWAAD